jgi:hypothetical protein
MHVKIDCMPDVDFHLAPYALHDAGPNRDPQAGPGDVPLTSIQAGVIEPHAPIVGFRQEHLHQWQGAVQPHNLPGRQLPVRLIDVPQERLGGLLIHWLARQLRQDAFFDKAPRFGLLLWRELLLAWVQSEVWLHQSATVLIAAGE